MNNYKKAVDMINNSDALLISASNGLSISEGYHIFADNDDFKKYFGKFREEYHLKNLLQGIFTLMDDDDRIEFNEALKKYFIDDYEGSDEFRNLKKIVGNKDYFIITSNGDKHFQLNGFDEDRIFEIEGNFFDNQEGSDLWKKQKISFEEFIKKYENKKLLIFELGIGKFNQMIKQPLMNLVSANQNYLYITLNMESEIFIPEGIKNQSLPLKGDISNTFIEMLNCN